MSLPIVISFQPDAAETVRASQVAQRRGRFGWIDWVIWPSLLGLALMYRLSGVPWRQLGLLYFVAIFLVALTVGAPWLQRRQLRRAYTESPIMRDSQRYEFSPEGFVIRGGPAATTLGWDAIREAVETDEFFLLFFARKAAYYVPKQAVADSQSATNLRVLLHSALGPRAREIRPAVDVPHI
jgi:hypothetical protein